MDARLLITLFKRVQQIGRWKFTPAWSNHCVKSVRIWSYSGPQFLAFGLNTERYGVYREMRSIWMRENAHQNNSEYGHFPRSEFFLYTTQLDVWCINKSLLNCVLYVLTCQRVLRALLLSRLTCSRAHVPTCLACLNAHVL